MKNKSYKIGEDYFDVPETETGAFLKENPDAIEVESFSIGKDTFDVPLNEVDAFLKENPEATSLKKKEYTQSEILSLGGSLGKSITETQKSPSDFSMSESVSPNLGTTNNQSVYQVKVSDTPNISAEFKSAQQNTLKANQKLDLQNAKDIADVISKQNQDISNEINLAVTDITKAKESADNAIGFAGGDINNPYVQNAIINYEQKLEQAQPLLKAKEYNKQLYDNQLKEIDLIKQRFKELGLDEEEVMAPETSYLEGGFKSYLKSGADFYDMFSGASKMLGDILGGKSKENLYLTSALLKKGADGVRKTADENLQDVPDNVIGDIVSGGTSMLLDIAASAVAPEIRIANLTGGALKTVPKFGIVLGAKGAGIEYSQGGSGMDAFSKGIEQGIEGSIMEGLGYIGSKGGEAAKRLGGGLLSESLAKATTTGGAFAGYEALKGETDPRRLIGSAALGAIFSTPEIASALYGKAAESFVTSRPSEIKEAVDVELTVEQLRNRINDVFAELETETSATKRKELFLVAQKLNKIADLKAMTDMVLKDPASKINDVLVDENLSQQEKEFVVDHIKKVVEQNDPRIKSIEPLVSELNKLKQEKQFNESLDVPQEVKDARNIEVDAKIKSTNEAISNAFKVPLDEYKIKEIDNKLGELTTELKNADPTNRAQIESDINLLEKSKQQLIKQKDEKSSKESYQEVSDQKSGKEDGGGEKGLLTEPVAETAKEVTVEEIKEPSESNDLDGVFEVINQDQTSSFFERKNGEVKEISEEEFIPLKENQDAIQKSKSTGVDVRQQANNGETMGEGNAQKETAKEGETKKITAEEYRKYNEELASEQAQAEKDYVPQEPTPEEKVSRLREMSDDDYVAMFIDSGMFAAQGKRGVERIDFGMPAEEINRGIRHIREGKSDSVAATRLKENILRTRESGEIPFVTGEGVNFGGRTNMPLSEMYDTLVESKRITPVRETAKPVEVKAEVEVPKEGAPKVKTEVVKEEPQTITQADGSVVKATKAEMDKLRDDFGFEPIQKDLRNVGQDGVDAIKYAEENAGVFRGIAQEVVDGNRQLTSKQKLSATYELSKSLKARQRAIDKIKEFGDSAIPDDVRMEFELANNDANFWTEVNTKAQTEWGKFGNNSQLLLRELNKFEYAKAKLDLIELDKNSKDAKERLAELESLDKKSKQDYAEIEKLREDYEKIAQELLDKNREIIEIVEREKGFREWAYKEIAKNKEAKVADINNKIKESKAKLKEILNKKAKIHGLEVTKQGVGNVFSEEFLREIVNLAELYSKKAGYSLAKVVDRIYNDVLELGEKNITRQQIADELGYKIDAELEAAKLRSDEYNAKEIKRLEKRLIELDKIIENKGIDESKPSKDKPTISEKTKALRAAVKEKNEIIKDLNKKNNSIERNKRSYKRLTDKQRLERMETYYERAIDELKKQNESGQYLKKQRPEQITSQKLNEMKAEYKKLKDIKKEILNKEADAKITENKTKEVIAKATYENQTKLKKLVGLGNAVLGGTLKGIQTAIDGVLFSKQAAALTIRLTAEGGYKKAVGMDTNINVKKAVFNMVKDVLNEEGFNKRNESLKNIEVKHDGVTYKSGEFIEKGKLSLSEGADPLDAVENNLFENKMYRYIGDVVQDGIKNKYLKKGFNVVRPGEYVRASNRAFASYLNQLRVMAYMERVSKLLKEGKTLEGNLKDFQAEADAINTLSGKASMGRLENLSPILNKFLYSARQITSELKILPIADILSYTIGNKKNAKGEPFIKGFYRQGTKSSNTYAVTTTLTHAGAWIATALLIDAFRDDVEFEFDPMAGSSGFLTLKIGDTRIKGGPAPLDYVGLAAVIGSDKQKFEGEYKDRDWGGVLSNAFQYKLSPELSAIIDYKRGGIDKDGNFKFKDVLGNKKTPGEYLLDKITPMPVGTAIEMANNDKSEDLWPYLILPAWLGVRMNTYSNKERDEQKLMDWYKKELDKSKRSPEEVKSENKAKKSENKKTEDERKAFLKKNNLVDPRIKKD